jgi:EAL domain-containing protein (putative c-di-GMP-specific phosphodiesterase class I)/GGDEF domain-containing protein
MKPATTTNAHAVLSMDDRVKRLRNLIDQELVSPVFQPIVCLQTGEIAGFEALGRPAREAGFAHVGELFEEAEHLGMLWELERITRRKTIAAANNFPEGVLLFLNSTPEVFTHPEFVKEVEQAVGKCEGLVPGRMVLEITEAGQEQVFDGLAERVRELMALGYQVAIDDAGAGASGLKRMMTLRPQWLKLDRALIDGVDKDRFQHNFIRFLVHFARLSGVNVVAEGIERFEQLGTLVDLGVRYGQGFLLAKPAPSYQLISEEVRRFVAERWQKSQTAHPSDPKSTPIGTLCQPASSVQAAARLDEVAATLLKSTEHPGVAVLDGRRFVGWCSRSVMLSAAAKERPGTPVGFITPASLSAIPPHASLAEAMELVSVREDADLTAPLVVADRDRVFGIVPLRTLLWAAAGQQNTQSHRADPLTRLPGRVAADQRVAELIRVAHTGHEEPYDAAIIDLQGFDSFNSRCGYDLGDQLLVDLASLLRTMTNAQSSPMFLAHLSVDRFLLIGRGGMVEPMLEDLIGRFDSTLAHTGTGRGEPAEPLRLRVLVMPGVFARIQQPRELSVLEMQLRARFQSEHLAGRFKGSGIVRDERANRGDALRLSA